MANGGNHGLKEKKKKCSIYFDRRNYTRDKPSIYHLKFMHTRIFPEIAFHIFNKNFPIYTNVTRSHFNVKKISTF